MRTGQCILKRENNWSLSIRIGKIKIKLYLCGNNMIIYLYILKEKSGKLSKTVENLI